MTRPRLVWIGGKFGSDEYPTVVSRSLRQVIKTLAATYRLPSDIKAHGYPEVWTGGLIDGYLVEFRFTATMKKTIDATEDESMRVYICGYEFEEGDREDESFDDEETC